MATIGIIGSGIAGIASSLRLRKMGYEVHVFEANGFPGGKMDSLQLGEYRFDMGPSLFTLPNLVDELFQLYGVDPGEYFQYIRKDEICNYFWEDGTRFTAYAEQEKFLDEATSVFKVERSTLSSYLNKSKKKYNLTAELFLEKSLHKASTFLNKKALRAIISAGSLDLMSTLNKVNEKTFQDPKLVQLFNRYATYNGSSPYKTPGIMSMIPHLEMDLGTYFPKGGMKSIPESLYQLAVFQGVKFHFNEPVRKINHHNGVATGITTDHGNFRADIIISNSDVFSSYNTLLGKDKASMRVMKEERSSSALIFYWGIKRSFPELDLHNILFSDNYEEEFRYIFDKKDVCSDPTIYINISGKCEPGDAPEGKENWFVMINTPGNFGQDWDEIIPRVRKQIIEKINRNLNIDLVNLIEEEAVLDPRIIESKTSSHRGSLYGTSSNSRFAAFLRHPNYSSKLKNLYFCGGSVHPGGGIPLCLFSAKIVSEFIKKQHGSHYTKTG